MHFSPPTFSCSLNASWGGGTAEQGTRCTFSRIRGCDYFVFIVKATKRHLHLIGNLWLGRSMSRYNLHKHFISTWVRHLSSVCLCESVCKPSCQPLSSLALYCLWHILGLPAAQCINRRTYLSAFSVIPMHSLLDFCWSMAFFNIKGLLGCTMLAQIFVQCSVRHVMKKIGCVQVSVGVRDS